ncbi:Hypothetical predicted protein [Scomber scombrus]|uniref:Uncharacterized protein n=1 Tax=Scomber scombrus TaxID=13677 RepID=A0AAV1QA94_SCOSC
MNYMEMCTKSQRPISFTGAKSSEVEPLLFESVADYLTSSKYLQQLQFALITQQILSCTSVFYNHTGRDPSRQKRAQRANLDVKLYKCIDWKPRRHSSRLLTDIRGNGQTLVNVETLAFPYKTNYSHMFSNRKKKESLIFLHPMQLFDIKTLFTVCNYIP